MSESAGPTKHKYVAVESSKTKSIAKKHEEKKKKTLKRLTQMRE
jgi:hypothetical protein